MPEQREGRACGSIRLPQSLLWGGVMLAVSTAVALTAVRNIPHPWAIMMLWWTLGVQFSLFAAAPVRAWGVMAVASVAAAAAAQSLGGGHPEHDPLRGVVMAVADPLICIATVWLARRVGGGRTDLGRLRDTVALLLAAGVAAPLLATLNLRALGMLLYGHPPPSPFAATWAAYAVGCVILAPLTLAIVCDGPWRITRATVRRWAVMTLCAVALGVVFWAVFASTLEGWRALLLCLLLVFPMMLGAALAGPLFAAATGLMLAIMADGLTSFGRGPMAALLRPPDSLIAAELFAAVTCAVSSILASVVRERTTLRALRDQSEHRFRIIAENSQDFIVQFDRDGRRLYRNPATLRTFRFTPEELVSTDHRLRVHPDDAELSAQARQKTLNGEVSRFRMRATAGDGSLRWVDMLITPVTESDGRVETYICYGRDITELTQAEQRARAAEERYRAFIAQSSEGIWRFDMASPLDTARPIEEQILAIERDAVLAECNAAMARMYGFDRPEELVGTPVRDLMPFDDPSNRQALADFIRQGYRIADRPTRERDRHGRERVFLNSVTGFVTDGRLTHAWGMQRDVTEESRVQRTLAEHNRIFEMITGDAPLGEILDEIVRSVQAHDSFLLGSVLLLNDDSQTVRTASAPDLPPEYVRAIDGLRIGPTAGSCGTAMWRRQRIVTHDVTTDPLWADFHPLVTCHGLRSCWSEPIVNSRGQILGTLAVYSPAPRSPSDAELAVVAAAARLAGVAVERRRLEAALAEAESRFRGLFQHASIGLARVSPSGQFLMVNRRAAEILGRPIEEIVGTSVFSITHPDDVQANVDVMRAQLADGDGYSLQKRYLRPDGSVLWAHVSVRIVRNEAGEPEHLISAIEDITDRVEAEHRLAASEERYRRLLTDVRVVAWEADPDTWRFTFVAGRAEDILGYPPEKWLEEGFWLSILHPDDRERAASYCLQQTRLGLNHEFEYRAIRSDGRTVWLRDLVSVELRDGRPAVMRGVMVDVTEQRTAEQALRESQATNLALITALPDLLFRVDATGRYLSYHAPTGTPLLAPPERFLGRTMREVLPPDLAELGMRALTAALQTGEIQSYEYQTSRHDRRRWWECRIVRTSPTEALIVVRDVTLRREAEEALRDSQRRFSLLINQSPIGVIVWNTRFEIAQWNPAAQRIFGFTPQEAIGRHADLIIPPDVRPRADELWRALMAQRGGSHSINENLTRSGDRIICEWHNTPLVGAGGAVIGVSSFVQDVTERVMSERQQRLMMQELDHRVKNNMAAVLSLAEQTGRATTDFDQFQATFMGRVRALARMHSALAASRWRGVDLRSLLRQTVEPYSGAATGRLDLDGPSVELPPRAAQALAMTFNELATNAAKHGALSAPAGKVSVHWTLERAENGAPAAAPILTLTWTERGGPPTRTPGTRGLGINLIEGAINHQLGGHVEFRFPGAGLECSLTAPLTPDESAAPFHLANGTR